MRTYERTNNLITSDGHSQIQYNYNIVIVTYYAHALLSVLHFYTRQLMSSIRQKHEASPYLVRELFSAGGHYSPRALFFVTKQSRLNFIIFYMHIHIDFLTLYGNAEVLKRKSCPRRNKGDVIVNSLQGEY